MANRAQWDQTPALRPAPKPPGQLHPKRQGPFCWTCMQEKGLTAIHWLQSAQPSSAQPGSAQTSGTHTGGTQPGRGRGGTALGDPGGEAQGAQLPLPRVGRLAGVTLCAGAARVLQGRVVVVLWWWQVCWSWS